MLLKYLNRIDKDYISEYKKTKYESQGFPNSIIRWGGWKILMGVFFYRVKGTGVILSILTFFKS